MALLKSELLKSATEVIRPSLLNEIPFFVDAPPTTALLIPRFPELTLILLSKLLGFIAAGKRDPVATFVPLTPEILSSLTAEFKMRSVVIALFPIRSAGISPLVKRAALWLGISDPERFEAAVIIPFVETVSFV